jgi:hypothetical protein
MRGFWYASAVVVAFFAFFGWKEGLVRHGWEGHDQCIYERLRNGMATEEASEFVEAIKACSSREAFEQWREDTKGGQGEDSSM